MASDLSRRPHRQARSGASYRDPHFDYEEASCRRLRSSITFISKKRGKNNAIKSNLIPNPTSITKERENAKERAEAVQLQRAIDESLLDKAPEAARHSHKTSLEDLPGTCAHSFTSSVSNEDIEKDVMSYLFDLKDVMMDQGGYSFQCLLDVASEAVESHVCKSQDAKRGSLDVQDSENQEFKFTMEKPQSDDKVTGYEVNMDGSKRKEDPPVNVKVNPMHQLDGDNGRALIEDESSDLSDKSWCKRTKPRKVELEGRRKDVDIIVSLCQPKLARIVSSAVSTVEQEGRSKDVHNIVSLGQGKTVSSGRSAVLIVENSSVTSCKTLNLQAKKRLAQTVFGSKENIPTCPSTPVLESTQSGFLQTPCLKPQATAEKGRMFGSCQNIQKFCGPCKMDKSESLISVSPSQEDAMRFRAEPSTLFHRRVIGLSRRFRPPPLHPYLSRQGR
ncbi:hypothetical protein GOP47_0008088 [Adiantum capillus-veneris]|uniref:Uncharacterized protein n=1 Tax=Adiantum capillus-veneris TaxID=13818 RepID=A0A9D4UYN7_ADICA|nr:hypothetical protein GOP47_0008088 [Adiantum capillus-veneris]